jgi:hypothetical protein
MKTPELMTPHRGLKSCYSNVYQADTPTASMRKLAHVAEQIVQRCLAELVDPGTVDLEKLRRLHAPRAASIYSRKEA